MNIERILSIGKEIYGPSVNISFARDEGRSYNQYYVSIGSGGKFRSEKGESLEECATKLEETLLKILEERKEKWS